MGQSFVPQRREVILLASLFWLSILAGAVTATEGGRIVASSSPDATMPYREATAAMVCYVDLDSSGAYYVGDGVLLSLDSGCGGNAGRDQIRLVGVGGEPAGNRAGRGLENGQLLQQPAEDPRFYYLDGDGSNSLTVGDEVYLRMTNPTAGFVAVGDIRISSTIPEKTGTYVASGDPDQGRAVTLLGTAAERVRHVDLLSTFTFQSEDHVYLTSDTSRSKAGPGDVRLLDPNDASRFGTFVEVGDPDAHPAHRAVSRDPCFVDSDGSGGYSPGDGLFLALRAECTGSVSSGDIRLNNGTEGPAGSRVDEASEDHAMTYGRLAEARVGVTGDTVFLDVNGDRSVSSGDVILTPTTRGAGFVVRDGDALAGTSLTDEGLFRDHTVFLGRNSQMTLLPSDIPYLSIQGSPSDGLRPGDIRLVPVRGHPFGGPVGIETGEAPSALVRAQASVCSTVSTSSDYDPVTEWVYLRVDGICPARVQEGLVRLVGYQDAEAPFSVVGGEDPDIGIGLVSVPSAQYRYTNVFTPSDRGWNSLEALYLDLRDASGAATDLGDLRLTPQKELPAGQAVLGGDWDLGQSLRTLGYVSALTAYVDIDRNGAFGPGDVAYVTPIDNHDSVTPLSVRLTALPAAFVAPPVTETPTESPPANGDNGAPSPSPGETETPPPEQDLTNTPTEGEDGTARTPGPAVAFVVVALAGSAWAVRRRS